MLTTDDNLMELGISSMYAEPDDTIEDGEIADGVCIDEIPTDDGSKLDIAPSTEVAPDDKLLAPALLVKTSALEETFFGAEAEEYAEEVDSAEIALGMDDALAAPAAGTELDIAFLLEV